MSFSNRAIMVALSVLVFDVTGREFDLGLLGLAAFAPVFLVSPFSGAVIDRFDRRTVTTVGLVVEVGVGVALFLYARGEAISIGPVLAVVVVLGLARAFVAPASRALPIDLSPVGVVERVVALRSVAFQIAGIIGPVLVGLLFAIDRALPFVVTIAGYVLAVVLLSLVPPSGVRRLAGRPGPVQAVRDAVEGLRFMVRSPVVFGAISLDLFAVLFGGAVALMPAIGEKRLGVDETAVGFMYSVTAAGALCVATLLSIRPIRRRVGVVLLSAIAVFGLATVVLGLTTSYPVALVALFVLSGADAISMFIRSTLVPLATPEEMRGRVLAVENIFIGGSNELGSLESGLTAAWFGLAPAVVMGGVGTLAVVGLWARLFPRLRQIDRFEEVVSSAHIGQ